MEKLVNTVKEKFDVIKEEVINNKTNELDNIINSVIKEEISNAKINTIGSIISNSILESRA